VTFERKDPLYVIGFENPTTPTILGQMNITGFSTYIHPINIANTLILTIGQEADDNGVAQGLQLSLFDATEPENLSLIDRYHDKDEYQGSTAEYEHESFRYLKLDEVSGRLIIPVSGFKNATYFDGFSVFIVTLEGIRHDFDISHVEETNLCYYWYVYIDLLSGFDYGLFKN
jgi:uncharacterized secreted protein with C-terminal beta-propeller domain